jgi:acyl-CoA thioester hydrolase
MREEFRTLLQEYPSVLALPVFWGDMDALGHVNNIVYFRWFEEARIQGIDGLAELRQLRKDKVGMILAHVECDFQRQSHYPDTMYVGSRLERIGTSSIVVRHCVASESQRAMVALGKATIVLFDYGAGKSHAIPSDLRAALEKSLGAPTDR